MVREHNLPDSKVDAGHLDTEENASYRSSKAAGNTSEIKYQKPALI